MLRIVIFLFIIHTTLADSQLSGTDDWEKWKQAHGKQYNGIRENHRRRAIWLTNAKRVREHNLRYEQGLETYYMRVNRFADLTWDEFKHIYLSQIDIDRFDDGLGRIAYRRLGVNTPSQIDWRTLGRVTPVRDQENCGASWAFAVAGALEGQWAVTFDKLVNVSVQQLIDCSKDFGNLGCNGGWMEYGYRYLNKYWIELENDYPYTGVDSKTCKADREDGMAKAGSYYSVQDGDEDVLLDLVGTFGPAAVAIDVDEGFMLYAGGVYNSYICQKHNPNHALLIVGYGIERGIQYWLMKNSLGTGFGEDGYIKLARDEDNMCGVASYASIPILKSLDF